MSSQREFPKSASKSPVLNWSLSWNRESAFVNGAFAKWSREQGAGLLAGMRILAVLVCAVSLEWHLAPLAIAGGAPLPVLAPVVACIVLTGSYKRMLWACVVAGLLHDAFSPSMPFGSSGLIYLLAGVLAREFCDGRSRCTPSEEFLVGAMVTGTVMLLGHGILAATGVTGSVATGVLVRRVLGSAFVAALVMVPLLRVANVLAGIFLARACRLFGGLLALLAAWALRHLNFADRPVHHYPDHDYPDHPVPAGS